MFVRYNQSHSILRWPLGECLGCQEGYKAFCKDAMSKGNRDKAWALKPRIKEYVAANPRCSASDIYKDLECYDIPMYIALHWLVAGAEIEGQDPYACGAGKWHTDWRYHIFEEVQQCP